MAVSLIADSKELAGRGTDGTMGVRDGYVSLIVRRFLIEGVLAYIHQFINSTVFLHGE